MKQVILKQLTLCNFKGEKERTTVFNPDVTTISGGNGLGKSRHFIAFLWLLFGKDTNDRKDYEIKTRINGEELHKVECSVTGIIEIDGQEITLKRSLVEDWVKPRQKVEQVFKGNHTECWWNDTPITVTEYTKRVAEIVDSSVFKMITNPAFFVNMPWKLQREQLFMLAGTISDDDVAALNPEFRLLLDKLNGTSMADFKRQIAEKMKRLKAQLAEIQPKIAQTLKLKPKEEDFAALERERDEITAQIAALEAQIQDRAKAIRGVYETEQAKQAQINELKQRLHKALFDAQLSENERALNENATRKELEVLLTSDERMLEILERDIKALEKSIEKIRKQIDEMDKKVEAQRQEWFRVNKSRYEDSAVAVELAQKYDNALSATYQGETVCPTCGQTLPIEVQNEAIRLFNEAKEKSLREIESRISEERSKFIQARKNELDRITASGKAMAQEVEEAKNNLCNDIASLEKADTEASELRVKIDEQKARLTTMPEIVARKLTENDVEVCKELVAQIEQLEQTLSTDTSTPDNSDNLKQQLTELKSKRDGIIERLTARDTIRRCDAEVAELETQGKELGQQIADLEKEEYTMRQFVKAKVEECENRINSLFTHVSFRLFDYTIEGKQLDEPTETCVPLVNGVPYGSANTAGQVNAGLDIINALCKFNGIYAPVFIDGAESVNEYLPMKSQTIFLRVTDSKELIVQ